MTERLKSLKTIRPYSLVIRDAAGLWYVVYLSLSLSLSSFISLSISLALSPFLSFSSAQLCVSLSFLVFPLSLSLHFFLSTPALSLSLIPPLHGPYPCILPTPLQTRYCVAKDIGFESTVGDVPCLSCPVRSDCSPTGQISPASCKYLQAWLEF